jgi:hypothetical protein
MSIVVRFLREVFGLAIRIVFSEWEENALADPPEFFMVIGNGKLRPMRKDCGVSGLSRAEECCETDVGASSFLEH